MPLSAASSSSPGTTIAALDEPNRRATPGKVSAPLPSSLMRSWADLIQLLEFGAFLDQAADQFAQAAIAGFDLTQRPQNGWFEFHQLRRVALDAELLDVLRRLLDGFENRGQAADTAGDLLGRQLELVGNHDKGVALAAKMCRLQGCIH